MPATIRELATTETPTTRIPVQYYPGTPATEGELLNARKPATAEIPGTA